MHSSRATLWVFADQAMVSGCNFVVSALMARYLGVAEFGQWILVFGLVLYANTVAGALVWLPMLNLTPGFATEAERQQFLTGSFACQLGLSVLAAMAIGVGGVVTSFVQPDWMSMSVVMGLAGVTLAFQLQDWLRRYLFAINLPQPVFALDVLAYGGQVALIVLFHACDHLSIENALGAVVLSYGLSFAAGVFLMQIRPNWREFKLSSRKLWSVGKAYLVGEQLQWVGTAGLLYTSAHVLGPHATGAVRAAQNLLGPTNMLFQALNNLVMVRSGAAYHSGGSPALSAYLKQVLWQFGLPLFTGLFFISLFGAKAMTLAFGESFAQFGNLVSLQSLQVALTFMWLLALFRVRTIGRSDMIMKAAALQALTSLICAASLAPWMHESGVVLASSLGVLAALTVLLKC